MGIVNVALRRIETENQELRLYIREDIFYENNKLGSLLMYEYYYILFCDKFDKSVASDISFAILWDGTVDTNEKKWLFKVWNSLHPPFNVTPNLIYYLAGYVKVISVNKAIHYRELLLDKFLDNQNKELSPIFPYQVAIPSLADFSRNELLVLRSIIKLNTKKQRVLGPETKLGTTTISKSVNKLLHLFMLRERVNYYPTGLEWINIFGLIHTDRLNSDLMYQFKYPWTRLITIFRGSSDLVYVNFHIPNTHYALQQYRKWLNQCLSDRSVDNEIVVKIFSDLVFGVEKEEYRYNVQNPELYDKENERWILGKVSKTNKIQPKKHFNQIKWSLLKRRIALEMIQKPYIKKEIYKKIGGNKNRVLKIINEIEESKIVQTQYVMPFFNELISVLIVYNGDMYNEIIQKVASIVPLSINYIFEKTIRSPHKFDSNLVGLAFVSIPTAHINQIQAEAMKIDNNSQFVLFPQNISTTISFDIEPTNNGWKFIKFPPIRFVK